MHNLSFNLLVIIPTRRVVSYSPDKYYKNVGAYFNFLFLLMTIPTLSKEYSDCCANINIYLTRCVDNFRNRNYR